MNALNTEACTNISSFSHISKDLSYGIQYRVPQNSLCIQQKNSQNDQSRYARTKIIPITIIELLQKSFLMICEPPFYDEKRRNFDLFT